MPEPLTDTARAALDHLDWTLATSSTNEEIDALLAWNLIEKIEGVHTEAHQFERTPLGCAIIAPDPVQRAAFQRTDGQGPETDALLAEIERRGLDIRRDQRPDARDRP